MAALFVPAPGGLDITRLHGVDPYDTGPQALHYSEAAKYIARPYGGSQAVWRVVGDLQCVVFFFERNASDYGSKNFFARNTRFIVGFEDGGLDEVPVLQLFRGWPPPAGDQSGFFATHGDVALDSFHVIPADQRSHFRFTAHRIA